MEHPVPVLNWFQTPADQDFHQLLTAVPLCSRWCAPAPALTPPPPAPHTPVHHTQEKSDVQPELPAHLAEGWGSLQALAVELAELQGAAGLPLTPEDYCREVLHPGLMQVGDGGGGGDRPWVVIGGSRRGGCGGEGGEDGGGKGGLGAVHCVNGGCWAAHDT
jgi:hypothetical protein